MTTAVDVPSNTPRRIRWRQLGMPAVIVLMLLVFGSQNRNVWSATNIANVSRQASTLALISIGQTFAIVSAGIDLSVGSLLALVSVVCAEEMLRFGVAGGMIASTFLNLAFIPVLYVVVKSLGAKRAQP